MYIDNHDIVGSECQKNNEFIHHGTQIRTNFIDCTQMNIYPNVARAEH